MNLLVLILLGAGVGWLAGVANPWRRVRLGTHVWLGVAGSFVAGVAGKGAIIAGLTPLSLGVSAGGALVLVLVANLVWAPVASRSERWN